MKSNLTTFDILFTYIGTVIGAGFASGQEINKFFCSYGVAGVSGIILATFLFIYLAGYLINRGYECKAESYQALFKGINSKVVKKIFDVFVIFSLMASVTAMFSGTVAFLEQIFNIKGYLGGAVFAVIVLVVVMAGIKYIADISKIVVPFIIIATILIAYLSIKGTNEVLINNNLDNFIDITRASFSGVLYACFNIVTAISILPALGCEAKSKNSIRRATYIGGIIIGCVVFLNYIAMLINYDIISNVEIPMEVVTKQIGVTANYIYSISFLIAIFTTAVSSLYGVYSRFDYNKFYLFIIVIMTYICSLVGFSNVVSYLYPFMGYIGIVMLIFLLCRGRRS